MKIDWKLKGSNLLRFGCGKSVTIHPETCSKMVLMDCDGSQSLYNWITNDDQFNLDGSLSEWLTNNLLSSGGGAIQVNASWNSNFVSLTDDNSQNLGYIGSNTANSVRVPFTTVDEYGVVKVGSGLTVSSGVLSVGLATTDYYGGLKLFANGDTIPSNGAPLKLSNGKAYADISGISINNYLKNWSGTDLDYSARIYDATDSFDGIDLLIDFGTYFTDYFNRLTPSPYKIYPIRADIRGRLYTFVNWEDTTYKEFAGTVANLVPNATSITGKTSKYLNAQGDWSTVSYSTLTGTPGVLGGSSTGYLVPAPSNTTTFLKSNGTWATPQDTTYEVAEANNPVGTLSVSEQTPNAIGCNVIDTAATPTLMAPVRYEEDLKLHGIVLDDLLSDHHFLEPLARVLASIIANDSDIKNEWNNALA